MLKSVGRVLILCGSVSLMLAIIVVPAIGAFGLWRYAHDQLDATIVVPEPDASTLSGSTSGTGTDAIANSVVNLRRIPLAVADWAESGSRSNALAALTAATEGATCVIAVSDGQLLIDRDLPAPALVGSAQKVLVGAVALDVLGPQFRFVTEVRGGEIVGGVHDGDLVIVGGGDPLLFSEAAIELARTNGLVPTDVGLLIDQLVAAGLQRVEGDIVGDGRRFDNEFILLDPQRPAERPPQISGLLINRGLLFGASYGLNPVQTAASEINRQLNARRIFVNGRSRSTIIEVAGNDNVLARVESIPLQQLVETMLLTDDDVAADMLLKAIGAEATGLGTRAAGLDVVRASLSKWKADLVAPTAVDHIDQGGQGQPSIDVMVDLSDGAGRDSRNLLSCGALALAASRLGIGGEPTSVRFANPGIFERVEILFGAAAGADERLVVVVIDGRFETEELLVDLSTGTLDRRLLEPQVVDLR